MARNVIVLKGDIAERYGEGRASATIKPGYLLMRFTDGTLRPHATAGGTFTGGMVATENPNSMIGKVLTESYASGDLVGWFVPQPGDEVQLVLKAGENAAMNSKLSSNGDGTVQVATGTEGVVFEALEALDLTALGDSFIPARRL